MTSNGFGILLILLEKGLRRDSTKLEKVFMNHRQDWKDRMNKNDDQGKRILNEPPLEMKMNEEKRKNRWEELEEPISKRGFRCKRTGRTRAD